MEIKIRSRQLLSVTTLSLYLAPLAFIAFYVLRMVPFKQSWWILSTGLILITISALVLYYFTYYWESALIQQLRVEPDESQAKQATIGKVTSLDTSFALSEEATATAHKEALVAKEFNLLETALNESQTQQQALTREIEHKNQALAHLEDEKRITLNKAEQITRDFYDYKIFSEEQLKQKSFLITNLQKTIEEQQAEIEKRQEQIHQLDGKVHDLSYEIKTLLYLHETESTPKLFFSSSESNHDKGQSIEENTLSKTIPYSISTSTLIEKEEINDSNRTLTLSSTDAATLLQRCIQIAQKLTGSNYYGNESTRNWELSSPHYAIDQRRLFDSLRSEDKGLVIVYSCHENKVLFANNQTKDLLGWNPEKFVQDFDLIIQDGFVDWKKALNFLKSAPEAQVRLYMRNKQGEKILVNCQLAVIPSGLFKNYIIGLLYLVH